MKRSRPTALPIGTISAGTLNANELIPAWIDALSGIRLSKADRIAVRRLSAEFDRLDPETDESYGETEAGICDELQTIAEQYAPDYAHVGTLDGDGAHFGVWADLDRLSEDCRMLVRPSGIAGRFISEVVRIKAGDNFPRYAPYVMEVSDHGNVTLYRRAGNRWIEVWAVV